LSNTNSNITVPVIAIDGPSGSGKGTIGTLLAKRLGWHFLDSGALYRILALSCTENGVPIDSPLAISKHASCGLDIEFRESTILLGGVDVTASIRVPECGAVASKIAVFPTVRAELLDMQLKFRQPPGLVADGRDMATVVFTDAILKIYLDASAEERASRRFKQLNGAQKNVSLDGLIYEIKARDSRDKTRAVAPLRPAADAKVIDTSGIGVQAVLVEVLKLVDELDI
jgi:cytidylate kinase